MLSKSGLLLIIITLMLVAVSGLTYAWSQASPILAPSATITVNTTADTIASDGQCSFREAILSANSNTAIGGCMSGSGADIIILNSGTYTLSILGAGEDAANTGDLDITDDLEIRGSDAATTLVTANGIDRVLHVDPTELGLNVEITNLTIQGGVVDILDSNGGGGVLSQGNLELDQVVVQANTALRGGGVRVTAFGELVINDSYIEGNTADDEGGGVYGDAPITLDNVQLVNNQAHRGGGIFCDAGCDFHDVSISDNQAAAGGGLYNDSISSLLNVVIDANFAADDGGGIFSEADLSLTNVTISDNFAENDGSGVFSEATAHLKNVTIADNKSFPGTWAALRNDYSGSLDLTNTIIADNYPFDCSGDLISLGHNIGSDTSCDLAGSSDLLNTDPLLYDLAENGGNTKTHALQFGSPAIDGGTNSECYTTDQRHFSRPTDGDGNGSYICDVGAYEAMPGGALRISPLVYTVEEAVGTVQILVERVEGVVGSVSVDYFTWEILDPNPANQNADYVGKMGTLTWADGDSSPKVITIVIIDDPSYEPDELFQVMLTNPSEGAGVVSTHRVADITILESDAGPPPGPTATPVPERDKSFLPVISDD